MVVVIVVLVSMVAIVIMIVMYGQYYMVVVLNENLSHWLETCRID